MNTPGNRNRKLNVRALASIGITCIMGWTFTLLATTMYRDYSWGLFIWLPLVMGATSTMIYAFKNTAETKALREISLLTLLIFFLGLLLFAWEGIICMLMSAPLGLFFTWLGHCLGYVIVKNSRRSVVNSTIILLLSVPSLMAFENSNNKKEVLRSVKTAIEINASPEKVWENVIAFPQLKQPTEFVFKTGIAYPVNATITGRGVGAVRKCNFSTGSFTEPVTDWQEGKLLKFSVTEQPDPMKEISFYDIRPNHLHGYWVSKQGEFKLTPLENGHTLLEGTTWYINKIKPGFYWTIWSDYIVHKIHERVLKHIKSEAESKAW
jgi:hypothetical protein